MIIDDSEETKRHTLVLLAEGSITKGKFVFIESMKKNKTTSVEVEVYAVADGTLKNLFDTKNQDTNKGEDKDNSKDNNSNDKKESDENTNNDKENSDNNSDSKDSDEAGTPKPTYTPFKQEMISGKTFYVLGEEQDDQEMTMVLGANKGQVWFSLTDSNTSPDVTFDFLINDEGYIIFSNTNEKGVISDDTPVASLLSESNNALTTCWGGNSVSDISDFCKDDDIKTWYKIKEEAETALKLKQSKDNETDENTNDNSDSNNSSDPGTQKPTFISFAKEMISDKTIFYVSSDGKGTYQFDPSGTGKLQYGGYHETINSPDLTFDWDISEQGNLIFSKVFFGSASVSNQVYSLSKKETSSLENCLSASNGSSGDEEYCSEEAWFYNKEDAEEASKE